MKRHTLSILLLILCFSKAISQTKIGINIAGGWGVGDAYNNFDAQLGIPVSFALHKRLHLVTGLELSRKNNLNQAISPKRRVSGDEPTILGSSPNYIFDAQQFSIYYLQVPILAKIEGRRLTCQAGLVSSVGLFGNSKTYERAYYKGWFYSVAEKIPDTENLKTLNFDSDKIKRFDLALQIGWGLRWDKTAVHLVTNQGLVNLNNNPQFNKMHNRNILISVDYFFGNKDKEQ
ncbi:MAG: outer membrane beta-barrel protein [Saprospiraceae bacterium]|nr:outer membrane beta-barrel protein [Saprospiraceae bacterium]